MRRPEDPRIPALQSGEYVKTTVWQQPVLLGVG